MNFTVTTHDIEANGIRYIMEWKHGEDGDGYIAITEACEQNGEDTCMHETHDFQEVNN